MGCNAHALGLNECVEISLRHRRRWHTRDSRYLYRYINTGYEGQCKTEDQKSLPSDRFRKKCWFDSVLISCSSLNTFSSNWAIRSSWLSIFLFPILDGVGDSSCFHFVGDIGLRMAGGCRGFTGMLHGKMVGIRDLTVPSLRSKCKLQILVFSFTLIGFLMMTSHLYLWSGSWGSRWNFTSHSHLSLLLEQPGMVHICYWGMRWCLTVQLSSQKSWNHTQGQIGKSSNTWITFSKITYQKLVLCPTFHAFSLSTPCHTL